MTIVVVTGTGTDIGKTVATAALAAAWRSAGARVGVCKPVQTGCEPGEPGDVDEVARLAGLDATQLQELYRYPEPLAPETAARRAGMGFPELPVLVARIGEFARQHDVTLVEGAGGILVRLGPDLTIVDVAAALAQQTDHQVETVVVTRPGLGTLSDTELTVDRLRDAGMTVGGVVIGAQPAEPDLAMQCNREDLPRLTGVPVVGAVPAASASLPPTDFVSHAPKWVSAAYLNRVWSS